MRTGAPFEIKMPQLIHELEDQFAESERLQEKISSDISQLI